MKIFDCFMYFDEEVVLDLRLNILNEYVDYFVIIESIFTHKGEKRKLLFDPKKFEKFKEKIIYLVFDQEPSEIEKINDNDSEDEKSKKYILNAAFRENGQRNFIIKGLNLSTINEKIILFRQDMFYYKFNLRLPNLAWTGTKACKKKHLEKPQWLRNIKDRKYPVYRFDVIFSKTKYIDIKLIKNGGWHFSNIKTAAQIEHKLKSYLHHREFDENPMSKNEISEIIKNKQAIYDLKVDKRINKIGEGNILEQYPLDKLPKFLQNNLENYKEWID